jgi:hypothetical protein
MPSQISDWSSSWESTYARELGAAVTALGDSAALLDVQKTELATGGLNNSRPVGASVVTRGSRRSAGKNHDNNPTTTIRVSQFVSSLDIVGEGEIIVTHGLRRR